MPEFNETISTNPATGEVIGKNPENSVAELQEAVKKAKAAQKEWAKLSVRERGNHLLLIRNFIAANAERIAETISKDNGKTRIDALSTEVIPASMAADYYAKKGAKLLARKRLKGGNLLFINKRSYVDRAPFGIIGIISPWNYSFAIPFNEIMMALIAGNAVLLKTATQTQETGKIIAETMAAGKLPAGLFTILNIPGAIAGDAFIECGINKLFFTGSVPVGKKLMAKAAEKLIPVSLELGGNDAMIVCKDADVYRAAVGAVWAGFSNCGQSCGGVERIYVEEGIYDKFMALLRERINALRIGTDENFDVDLGSLTTRGQLNTVKKHVQDAIEKGAVITAKAEPKNVNPNGLFHPALALENVTDEMLTMRDETFGPVVAVQKVKDIDEAVARANNSNLGLTASIWTSDKAKARAIAARLEAGAVTINDHLMSHGLSETPWGGFKESGIGRTHSYIGVEEMTQPRTVVEDIMPGLRKNMWWHPHSKKVYDGLLGVVNFQYGSDLNKKINGLISLSKLFARSFKAD
jgi:succinate-semialdehyde dehydrogenase/glutarate-semialdehyde dehydrogenase